MGHLSIEIGDDVWTGHLVYITDQNHGYEDLGLPISRQFKPERPVVDRRRLVARPRHGGAARRPHRPARRRGRRLGRRRRPARPLRRRGHAGPPHPPLRRGRGLEARVLSGRPPTRGPLPGQRPAARSAGDQPMSSGTMQLGMPFASAKASMRSVIGPPSCSRRRARRGRPASWRSGRGGRPGSGPSRRTRPRSTPSCGPVGAGSARSCATWRSSSAVAWSTTSARWRRASSSGSIVREGRGRRQGGAGACAVAAHTGSARVGPRLVGEPVRRLLVAEEQHVDPHGGEREPTTTSSTARTPQRRPAGRRRLVERGLGHDDVDAAAAAGAGGR